MPHPHRDRRKQQTTVYGAQLVFVRSFLFDGGYADVLRTPLWRIARHDWRLKRVST